MMTREDYLNCVTQGVRANISSILPREEFAGLEAHDPALHCALLSLLQAFDVVEAALLAAARREGILS